ncbi:MAG TPA: D-alanine--poly(phosphoribitol) ligase subunit 2 [Symbiobacteriaceae bacterium]|nr:D-alanine--poly(phosphoribitol) ligase subunit 2 [Symbiobacteriaceae bacterium]
MTVLERVQNVAAAVAKDEEPKQNPDVHLYETGLIDSFGTVELMLALEQEFGIPFSPAEFDAEAWATPRLIAGIVEGRV